MSFVDKYKYAEYFLSNIKCHPNDIITINNIKPFVSLNQDNNSLEHVDTVINNEIILILLTIQRDLELENKTIEITKDCYKRYYYKYNKTNDTLLYCFLVLAYKFNEDNNIKLLLDYIENKFNIDKKDVLKNEFYYFSKIDFILSIYM